MGTKIFVNLPVGDLGKTVKFFAALGFKFNPKFTDENATCMIIDDKNGIYAMLLVEKFFRTFTKKGICDTARDTEAIIALSVESREMVDGMVRKAVKAGGSEPREKQDHGWMYGRSFQDLDGHLWEVFCMDEGKMPQA